MDGSALERRLRQLVDRYHEAKQEKLEMGRLIDELNQRLTKSEALVKTLRAQLDEAQRDRFSVKQLKDERKQIRRKLEAALARLSALEEEL